MLAVRFRCFILWNSNIKELQFLTQSLSICEVNSITVSLVNLEKCFKNFQEALY